MSNIGDTVDREFVDNNKPWDVREDQIGTLMRAIQYFALYAAAKQFGYTEDIDRGKIERFIARKRLRGEFKAVHDKELSYLVATSPLARAYVKALTKVVESSDRKSVV